MDYYTHKMWQQTPQWQVPCHVTSQFFTPDHGSCCMFVLLP